MYELDAEAEVVYEEIVEKYNDQFNLKWSGMLQIINMVLITGSYPNYNNVNLHTYFKELYVYYSGSQENLDELDKADIAVHTKALELIGCLLCIVDIQ